MIEELYKELRVVLTLKPELETLVIFSSVKRFSLKKNSAENKMSTLVIFSSVKIFSLKKFS